MMALWYKNFTCRPGAPDNRERSADACLRSLAEAGADQNTQHRIGVLLHGHYTDALSHDAAIVADSDLAILGADPNVYAHYAKHIGLEYIAHHGHGSIARFIRERVAFLEHLLQRPTLYRTPWFADRYTVQARQNMRNELRDLCMPARIHEG